jgi:death on curing protein
MIPNAWQWVAIETVIAVQNKQLSEFGGADGVRDQGLLESALGRPVHQAAYGKPDAADLAAAYAFGIARNHPFIDGNKRCAFVTAVLFLEKNGYDFSAREVDVVLTIFALAAGELSEKALAEWFRAYIKPR